MTKALLSSSEFRDEVGTTFTTNVSKSATGEEKRVITENAKKIAASISELLARPDFNADLNAISQTVFTFYIEGSRAPTTIDIKPIAILGLDALKKVDPQFKALSKEVDKLKPIQLKPQTSGPDVKKLRELLKLSFYLGWIFMIIFNLIFFLAAKSRKYGLRFLGFEFLWLGTISLLIKVIGSLILVNVADKNSDLIAKIAIPIVGNELLSAFLLTGLIYFIGGALLLAASFMRRFNGQPVLVGA